MHHALQIDEILRHIFAHFSSPVTRFTPPTYYDPGRRWVETSSLAALARTCRAFKEPALDILWSVLLDLSPLALCLPDASHRSCVGQKASFTRSLTKAEWGILRSYTRRTRSIIHFNKGLNWESVRTYLNPPATEPLFPNLRHLHCQYTERSLTLLRLPLPSLVTLDVRLEDRNWSPNPLESFLSCSSDIRELSIHLDRHENIRSNYLSRWNNLSSLVCPDILLNMDDITHLSHMPTLIQLDFTLDTTLQASDSLNVFSHLGDLTLRSQSLVPISQLLSQTRLPALMGLHARVENCPSRQDLASFFSGVRTSNITHTIEKLLLIHSHDGSPGLDGLRLGFEDLYLCMAFSNLRRVEIDIGCNVGLTSVQVLTLASAWPKLVCFSINAGWSWNASAVHGITPDGLVRLFRTCPSLSRVDLCLDTRGYAEAPSSHLPPSLGLTFSSPLLIDFVDSVIEADSVTAVAAFIRRLAACSSSSFTFVAWGIHLMTDLSRGSEYARRWEDVEDLVHGTLHPRPES